MKIYRVTDKEFLPFGKVIDIDTEEDFEYAEYLISKKDVTNDLNKGK